MDSIPLMWENEPLDDDDPGLDGHGNRRRERGLPRSALAVQDDRHVERQHRVQPIVHPDGSRQSPNHDDGRALPLTIEHSPAELLEEVHPVEPRDGRARGQDAGNT